MQRTCEPELMDDGLQASAYAAADFSAGDQAVLERCVAVLGERPLASRQRLLDLGCGPGNITFLLAERFPSAQVIGVDGAAAMLQIARTRQAQDPYRWGALSFVQGLLCADGLQSDSRGAAALAAGFDAVVSNSLLHHLHEPQVLWQALPALAAPGAAVYIKDLRRPLSEQAALALRERYLAGAPEVLQRDYLASLHAAFTTAEVRLQLHHAGLDQSLQVKELDDRYLEVWGHLG
ncbi:MAG: class I SAM-dependent methyltransferase [Prochlorococcaceae cyanobacterium]|jgi:trans-aconitate 2-methyltransferase